MIFQILHHAKCPFNKIDNSLRLQTRAKRNTNKQLKNKMQMSELCYSFQKLRKVYKHKKKFSKFNPENDPWFDRGAEGRQTILETAKKPNVWKYSRCVVV